jgi:hypothetical protein
VNREIAVVFYGFRLINDQWRPPALAQEPRGFVAKLSADYKKYGVAITCLDEPEVMLEVGGYADLLNTVRLRTGDGMLGNPCLGHVIGQSQNCDLLEDLQRGISRVAFAPETIEPEGSSKRVCHNCGCGC